MSAGRAAATLESLAAPAEDGIEEIAADEQTDPNMATVNPAAAPAGDEFSDEPTRQSHLSEALASSTAPHAAGAWDEPTRERLDVVREFLQQPPPPEPSSYTRIPDPVVHEKSIIVDEDIAMTEPIAGDELRAVRSEANDDERRERLSRCCARPSFSLDRISQLSDGRTAYRLKYPTRGATHRIMTPVES
jgi:hypothetical protein